MADPIEARSQSGLRWFRLQSLLTLDAVWPLYGLMGLPLGDQGATLFQATLRRFFQAGEPSVAGLSPGQTWDPDPNRAVLAFLAAEFPPGLSDRYLRWATEVFVYDPGEYNDWWEWRKVFAACANRTAWWDRLGLPTPLAADAFEQFGGMKAVNQEARDLAEEAGRRPETPWDRATTKAMGLTAQRREFGEPFSAPLNTVTLHQFHRFWGWFLSELTPPRFDELYGRGLLLAQELKIPAGALVHPSLLLPPDV